jgi:hypothetical protein
MLDSDSLLDELLDSELLSDSLAELLPLTLSDSLAELLSDSLAELLSDSLEEGEEDSPPAEGEEDSPPAEGEEDSSSASTPQWAHRTDNGTCLVTPSWLMTSKSSSAKTVATGSSSIFLVLICRSSPRD